MKYKILFLIAITTILSGCSGGSWDVFLCAQKIEGSSKIIYKYDAWGGRDSHKSGYAILDSSVTFDMNKIDELPILYLTSIPNKVQINAVNVLPPDSSKNAIYKPINTYKIKEQNNHQHKKISI